MTNRKSSRSTFSGKSNLTLPGNLTVQSDSSGFSFGEKNPSIGIWTFAHHHLHFCLGKTIPLFVTNRGLLGGRFQRTCAFAFQPSPESHVLRLNFFSEDQARQITDDQEHDVSNHADHVAVKTKIESAQVEDLSSVRGKRGIRCKKKVGNNPNHHSFAICPAAQKGEQEQTSKSAGDDGR